MKIFSWQKISLIILITILPSLILPISTKAIEYGGLGGKPAYPDPSNSRTKSIFVYTLEPGTEKTDGLLVVNNTQETKTVLVYATDSQKSSDGSFACEQYTDEKTNVGKWITLEKAEVTLEPSKNIITPFKINVPDTASVGEENGCILIQEKKETDSVTSGVSLSFRTGLRVAITIPGEQIRELSYENVNVELTDQKITARVSAKNSGNVSIDTQVKVLTNSILGINYNTIDNQYPILRGEISTYNFEIERPYWGGIFTIQSQLEYDKSANAVLGIETQEPKEIISSESFTLFVAPNPIALIIEIIAVLIILIVIFILVKRLRQENKTKKMWSQSYIVKEGEDIESIAKQNKLNWEDIVKYNKLKPPYTLKKGQKILLKAN